MDNLIPYIVDRRGKQWYICRDCCNKEQIKRLFCPVCGNVKPSTNPEIKKAIAQVIAENRRKGNV